MNSSYLGSCDCSSLANPRNNRTATNLKMDSAKHAKADWESKSVLSPWPALSSIHGNTDRLLSYFPLRPSQFLVEYIERSCIVALCCTYLWIASKLWNSLAVIVLLSDSNMAEKSAKYRQEIQQVSIHQTFIDSELLLCSFNFVALLNMRFSCILIDLLLALELGSICILSIPDLQVFLWLWLR